MQWEECNAETNLLMIIGFNFKNAAQRSFLFMIYIQIRPTTFDFMNSTQKGNEGIVFFTYPVHGAGHGHLQHAHHGQGRGAQAALI